MVFFLKTFSFCLNMFINVFNVLYVLNSFRKKSHLKQKNHLLNIYLLYLLYLLKRIFTFKYFETFLRYILTFN